MMLCFVAALRQLSEFCAFGGALEQMIRDRIMVAVNSEKIQLRLLAEPDLTHAQCLQLAQSMESAEVDGVRYKEARKIRKWKYPLPPVKRQKVRWKWSILWKIL